MTSPVAPARFPDRIASLCDGHPGARAIELEGAWTTWGDVARRRSALHAVLERAGLAATDPVGVVVRERPPSVAALLALLADERPIVLVQSIASDDEIAVDIGRIEAAALVAETRDWDRARLRDVVQAAAMAGVSLGEAPTDVTLVFPRSASPPPVDGVDPRIAVLVPTSGTSGTPRRHPVTRATLDRARETVRVRAPEEAQGATINTVPLSSIGGLMGLVSTVWRGRPIAVMERFDVEQWAALVREHRPHRIGVPPAAIRTIVERDLPADLFAGVECLTTGSAPLDAHAARAFADRYGIAVLNAYGATELGGPVVAWRDDDWEPWGSTKLGSAGRALPGVELRVVEPEARAFDDGDDHDHDHDTGVLEVRRSGGEWVRTTDLARIDDDGFVWIVGRVDDVIVRGGFKVSAAAVEQALTAHPSVADAVVVGVPDARLGAVPAAVVTLHPGSSPLTGEELRDHARTLLAPYKVPVTIRVVDEIPCNAMMKPRRARIRAILASAP